jgi:hypothetical protein
VSRLSKTRLQYSDLTAARTRWLSSPTSGTEGWLDTACVAEGTGNPYRDAILSSDGFWTIDIQLESFRIGDVAKPQGVRYVRLLIRPQKWGGGRAQAVANEHYITTRDRVRFAGPVVVERNAEGDILEVQPVDELEVTDRAGTPLPQ